LAALAFFGAILLAAGTILLAALFLAAGSVGAILAVVHCAGGIGASANVLMLAAFSGLCGSGVANFFSSVVVASSHTESESSGDESS
jgi:membrane protein implicated in regulation of membrane protease activity